MDYAWASVSVFPNGQVVYGTEVGCDITLARLQLVDGIKDLRFVLDELSRLNTSDALFAGRLDRSGWALLASPLIHGGRGILSDRRALQSGGSVRLGRDTGGGHQFNQIGLQKPFC